MRLAPRAGWAMDTPSSHTMNLRLLPVALLVCALAACTPKSKVDETAVFGAIQENLSAMQREDINGVMATVHPETPDFEASRAVFEEIFAKYDLKYDLRELKVVGTTETEVKVSYVQKTQRVGGATDLPDNIVEGVHTLKKDGDKWKLLRTVSIRFTPLKP